MEEELAECCLQEQELAAQVIVSSEEGLLAWKAVHAALRTMPVRPKRDTSRDGLKKIDSQKGLSRRFNPLKEYTNVSVLGVQDEMLLSQQKLMTIVGSIDFVGKLLL